MVVDLEIHNNQLTSLKGNVQEFKQHVCRRLLTDALRCGFESFCNGRFLQYGDLRDRKMRISLEGDAYTPPYYIGGI